MFIPAMQPVGERPAGQRCEVTLRDTFAAAALTGLLGSGDLVIAPRNLTAVTLTVRDAYRWADAMLRERGTAFLDNCSAGNQREIECPVTEPMPKEKRAELSDGMPTNHDAAPAAKASADSVAPQPTAIGGSDGTDKPATRPAAGAGDTPMNIEELLGELHHIAGSEDHVEYDIRRTACDAEHAIDRLRAWVNELQLSKVEIDALQHVVEDGRIVDLSDYGYLRSLLVRLRPEWEDESDRSEPIANGPDADSRVWETPAKTDPTPPRNGTPAKGTVQDEGSVPDSSTENGPVAWWVKGNEYESVTLLREHADAMAEPYGTTPIPLYRSPTLTDEERQAIRTAAGSLGLWVSQNGLADDESLRLALVTLRGLLERTK